MQLSAPSVKTACPCTTHSSPCSPMARATATNSRACSIAPSGRSGERSTSATSTRCSIGSGATATSRSCAPSHSRGAPTASSTPSPTAGRRELHDWLHAPTPAAGYRDDLYLKLVAGARAGHEQLAGVIARERQASCWPSYMHSASSPRASAIRSGRLLNAGAALQVEARIKLLELAERDVLILVSSTQAQEPAAGLSPPSQDQLSGLTRRAAHVTSGFRDSAGAARRRPVEPVVRGAASAGRALGLAPRRERAGAGEILGHCSDQVLRMTLVQPWSRLPKCS